eukprot:GHVU01038620.1.p1 GENE.GHVU01038620.1~~GHVU01038620.1.p1  ORF type:complete len:362 (+),score=39.45 GHVU01038620.1:203-1288(+)
MLAATPEEGCDDACNSNNEVHTEEDDPNTKCSNNEGSVCPICLQGMVRDLCTNARCGHVFHEVCVVPREGMDILQCPCCQAAPFNPRRLFFELAATTGNDEQDAAAMAAGERGKGGYEVEMLGLEKQNQLYRVQFHNGSVFEGKYDVKRVQGSLAEPIKNGTGNMMYAAGGSYRGQWKDGVPHGTGRKVFANGDVYDGFFSEGVEHGRGSLRRSDGGTFDGSWARGAPTSGLWQTHDGSKFRGDVRLGALHGEGVQNKPDGSTIQGRWVSGVLTGEFKLHRVLDGSIVRGTYVGGEPHGPVEIVEGPTGRIIRGTAERGRLRDAHIEEPARPLQGPRLVTYRSVSERPLDLDRLQDLFAAL